MSERLSFDLLIIGAGPAGIAAACCAAESGARVGLVDDNPAHGGQIWRGEPARSAHRPAAAWLTRVRQTNVHWIGSTSVVAAPDHHLLIAEGPEQDYQLHYERLILATGARELFLPFPGWTLPDVLGVGGLQAMVKMGLPIRGRRVIVAGSGPLLLAVATYLRKRGATVVLVAEQAPARNVLRFGLTLLTHPGKLVEALSLRWRLLGVPYQMDTWPVAATKKGASLVVTLSRNGQLEERACDYLACGFGLIPNLELPRLLGCRTDESVVIVDEWQATSVEGVYAVGELTGIGGLDKSLIEGQIAGYAAAGKHDQARAGFPRREVAKMFADRLDRAFTPRNELRQLPAPDTLVCRCEDVTIDHLRRHESWREAKLQTRCGMGPCQGRICGTAARFLLGWEDNSVRPPVLPTSVQTLVSMASAPSVSPSSDTFPGPN